jgi:hypothetical protein
MSSGPVPGSKNFAEGSLSYLILNLVLVLTEGQVLWGSKEVLFLLHLMRRGFINEWRNGMVEIEGNERNRIWEVGNMGSRDDIIVIESSLVE